MTNHTDRQLLTTYLAKGEHSHDAFRALTTRYVGLIYATAKRQAPPHLAEDITQAVFLLLAQKAHTLRNPQLLPAWLLKITRYCAANARRADQRRLHHEQKAAAMTPTLTAGPTDPDDPDALAPHLDTALLSLPSIDRTALLLRYYNNQPLTEIAHALNISEEAAKKRVTRALEKLRKLFTKKHLPLAAPALAATLAKQATAAPAHLAANCATAALTNATTPAASLIAKGALKLIAYTTAKWTAAAAAALLLITVITAQLVPARLAPPVAPITTPIAAPSISPAIRAGPDMPLDPPPIIEVRDMVTNQPLANVAIECSPGFRQGRSTTAATNAAGIATLAFPPTYTDSLDLYARKEGYVPAATGAFRAFPGDPLQTHLTLHLEKAITIGGRVVDDHGTPLPNATLDILISKQYKDQYLPWNLSAATDANGRWSLNAVPQDCQTIKVGAYHPSCISTGFIGSDEMPIASLRDRSAVITLKRGTPFHAIVHGPDGKPLKAFVGISDQRTAANTVPEFPTSDIGEFDLMTNPHQPLDFVVRADGLAPKVLHYQPGDPAPLLITLQPAMPLTLHIVDPAGHSIPNAVFATDYFITPAQRYTRPLDKVLISDNDGRITWPDPFIEKLFVNLSARGFLARTEAPVTPGQTNEITLLPRFVVHGTVIDDDTGKPADNFRVVKGTFDSVDRKTIHYTDYPEWDANHIRRTGPGAFDFADTAQDDQFVLRVLGGDYKPADSERIISDGSDQSVTIHVHKGQRLAGTLLNVNGDPLPNTYVYLRTTWYDIYDADIPTKPTIDPSYNDSDRFALTNANGEFSFPPQQGNFMLIASNATGYAIIKQRAFKKDPTLQLLSWSRIEGTFLNPDGTPAPNAPVSAHLDTREFQDAIGPFCHFNTKTDAVGHFSIPKAFAGPYRIEKATFKALPGETATVIIKK